MEYKDEEWKEAPLKYEKNQKRLHISNYGRIKTVNRHGGERMLKIHNIQGYPAYSHRLKVKDKKTGKIKTKYQTIYLHRLVAELFLGKAPSKHHEYVIHKDYNKENNHVSNLEWATTVKVADHQQKSPNVIRAKKWRKENPVYRHKGHKLTSTQVKLIKKKIFDPNRTTRMKMIAKQFGISEMQLYRIKSGENWGHVKIDDEETK